MLFIPLAIGAGLGALGGFMQGRQGAPTQTQTSKLDPYGGTGNLDFMLNEARNLYENYMPWNNQYSRRAYRQIYGGGGNRQQGGGGGGGQPQAQQQAQPQAQAGGGGGGDPYGWLNQFMPGRGGGGGGGGGQPQGPPQFLGWEATPNEYLQPIIEGQNLDVANNPYVQEMIGQLSDQAQVDFERSLPGIQAQFAAAGRYGSGASAAQQALAQGEMQRALAGQQAATQMQAYQQALEQQMQGLGMLSQETMQGRGAWQEDIANRRTTDAQRAAARMGLMGQLAAVRGGLQEAQIMANVSRRNAELQHAAQMAQVAASRGNQAAALAYQKQADQMRYSLAMDQQMMAGANQGWGNLANYQGAVMPIAQTFGTQTQTMQGPKPNMFGSILGGAMSGMGIGGMFGGGGGGGGGGQWYPNQGTQAFDMFNSMMGRF